MAAPFVIPPASGMTLGQSLQRRGLSRRVLLKYASYLGALMALPASTTQAFAGLASGFYRAVSDPPLVFAAAAVAGLALGAGSAWMTRRHLAAAGKETPTQEGGKP